MDEASGWFELVGEGMGKWEEEEVGVCNELPSVSVSVSASSSEISGVGGNDAAVMLKNSLSSGS